MKKMEEDLRDYQKITPERYSIKPLSKRKINIIKKVALYSSYTAVIGFSIGYINFELAQYYINKGFSKERTEIELKRNTESQKSKEDKILRKIILENPLGKSGRDLAYFLVKENKTKEQSK